MVPHFAPKTRRKRARRRAAGAAGAGARAPRVPYGANEMLVSLIGYVYLWLSMLFISFEAVVCAAYVSVVWVTLALILAYRTCSSVSRTLFTTLSVRGGVYSFFRAWVLKRACVFLAPLPTVRRARAHPNTTPTSTTSPTRARPHGDNVPRVH